MQLSLVLDARLSTPSTMAAGGTMPLSSDAVTAVTDRVRDGITAMTPPFFGVNIYDVSEANLAEFSGRLEPIRQRVLGLPGVSVVFRGMHDHGPGKRIFALARYDEPVDLADWRKRNDD